MPEPKPQTDADRSLMRDIATRGWHIVTVEERNDRPGWAFTIGLQSSFEHPEVIVFGLPTQANREIIERIARDIAAGSAHPAGSTCDTILQGLPCEFRAVARSWHETFLGYAVWYYGNPNFRVVQFLWPDRENRFPNQPDFDPDLARLQPLLEHASAEEARVSDVLHSLDKV
jgi:hypothetical protein